MSFYFKPGDFQYQGEIQPLDHDASQYCQYLYDYVIAQLGQPFQIVIENGDNWTSIDPTQNVGNVFPIKGNYQLHLFASSPRPIPKQPVEKVDSIPILENQPLPETQVTISIFINDNPYGQTVTPSNFDMMDIINQVMMPQGQQIDNVGIYDMNGNIIQFEQNSLNDIAKQLGALMINITTCRIEVDQSHQQQSFNQQSQFDQQQETNQAFQEKQFLYLNISNQNQYDNLQIQTQHNNLEIQNQYQQQNQPIQNRQRLQAKLLIKVIVNEYDMGELSFSSSMTLCEIINQIPIQRDHIIINQRLYSANRRSLIEIDPSIQLTSLIYNTQPFEIHIETISKKEQIAVYLNSSFCCNLELLRIFNLRLSEIINFIPIQPGYEVNHYGFYSQNGELIVSDHNLRAADAIHSNFLPIFYIEAQKIQLPQQSNEQQKLKQQQITNAIQQLPPTPPVEIRVREVMNEMRVLKSVSLFIDRNGEYMIYMFHDPINIQGCLIKAKSTPKLNFKQANQVWVSVQKVKIAQILENYIAIEWDNGNISSIRVKQL